MAAAHRGDRVSARVAGVGNHDGSRNCESGAAWHQRPVTKAPFYCLIESLTPQAFTLIDLSYCDALSLWNSTRHLERRSTFSVGSWFANGDQRNLLQSGEMIFFVGFAFGG